MSHLLNSYLQRPGSSILTGVAAIGLAAGTATMTATALSGVSALVVGQSARLRGGKAIAAVSPLVKIGQAGALVPGVAQLSGSSPVLFAESATLRRVAGLRGGHGLVFGRSAVLRLGAQMAGTAALGFGQDALLRKAKKMAGSATATVGQSARLQVAMWPAVSVAQYGETGVGSVWKFNSTEFVQNIEPTMVGEFQTGTHQLWLYHPVRGYELNNTFVINAAGYYDLALNRLNHTQDFQGTAQLVNVTPPFGGDAPEGHDPMEWFYG